MAAVLDQLEDAIVAAISGLNLMLGSTPVAVSRKKIVRVEEVLDTPSIPLITVAVASQPGKDQWWQTPGTGSPKGSKRREYAVEVHLAARGNRDPTANEGTYQLWREKVLGAFEPIDDLGVSALYDVQIDPGPSANREDFPRNLDTSRIFLRLVTVEPASN